MVDEFYEYRSFFVTTSTTSVNEQARLPKLAIFLLLIGDKKNCIFFVKMIKKILSFFIVLSIFQLLASIECKSEDPKRERVRTI